MRGVRWAAAAFAAGIISVSGASAATIEFSGLSQDGTGLRNLGTSYAQDGLDFAVNGGPYGQELGVWQRSSADHPVGGDATTSITSYFAGSTFTMTPVSGLFSLASIDIGQWGANQGGGSGTFTVTFDGLKANNSHVFQTFTVPNVAGSPVLSTYSFSGFTGLQQVSVVQGVFQAGQAWQFDNINTGVPEPAAWGLMIAGFGLAGAALRRRRSVPA